jgi:hypothetical protein
MVSAMPNAVRKRGPVTVGNTNMKSNPSVRAATLALATFVAVASNALAGPENYDLHLVENEIRQGADATIAVKLVDRRTAKPVDNAIVFATRMDMAPDGMEAMTSPVEAMPSDEPGVYRFKTNLMMAGGWRFSIAAKVQGEPATIERRLEFRAVE